ncbi:acetolactate synthase-1/2/3 large subunit [Enhydrobacter aerosaccus]|uniref:Acetolactate synthase-1/2/3 large subunit n=1 Tax=Enhydrobacter aerosaccus TaxID=225324 RepID=A0A1T4SX52_9HYPH|nr:thiamine pyrophosphate-binding protein [Enhydrobacter aerosaccus]SKA32508.1 acetolactate synthase-1/2/3 large subunit [Enhydrobacter aerosaccus]
MQTTHARRSGAQVLIDQLRIHGAETIFGVPGESYLAALDALYAQRNSIRYVICRQEGGAANMAEAYGKLTGKPGICFVTRGPGATNASIGLHTGFQDSTPMILLVGQVAREQAEREAFQEIDYRRMFGQMAKWVAQIEDARRIPELVSQAFHRAVNGRPGPVVLALPEDMLTDEVEVADAIPYKIARGAPSPEDMATLRALLEEARQPMVILGGGGWTAQACADIRAFIEANNLPVTTAFRNQDLLDNRHPNFVGDLGVGASPPLAERIKGCDLIVAIGPRLGEATTAGYTLFDIPVPRQKLVHVHAGAEELGRVFEATLPINSGMAHFARAARTMKPVDGSRWKAHVEAGRAAYLKNIEPNEQPGAVNMTEVIAWLNKRLPDDVIVTNGAGNYAAFVHRFFQYRGFRTQLAPTSGAMGYGVPAAVAAKIAQPDRMVVSFAGDGCFLMNGQEFATAVQHGANVVIVVVDNGMYGTIRMHQEREYPTRVHGTELKNPDFAAYARAFGGHGETVERTADFEAAFERALAAGKPAIIHVKTDPEALTSRITLSKLREQSLAKQKH